MSKKVALKDGIALYKAFCSIQPEVDETNADQMIVDTSGDDFGTSPEDAIRNLYQSMPVQDAGKVVTQMFFGAEDKEVDLHSPNAGDKLILLKLIPNKPEELKDAIISGEIGKDCKIAVAITELKKGVTNCLAEYYVDHTKVWLKNNTDPDSIVLLAFGGERQTPDTDQFPAEIKFKVTKARRDIAFEAIGDKKAKKDEENAEEADA